MKKVIFIGAGGYAKSVLDSLDSNKYQFCGFIDSFKQVGSTHLGFPILAKNIDEFTERQQYSFFISIGSNQHRLEKFIKLQQYNCDVINVIDRSAMVSTNVQLGCGVFVGKMAIINSGVSIGNNVIVNTKALIEHGCSVAHHCNISTNATLNGDVCVQQQCFIGSSSVIVGQLTIGEQAVVGAGAVVIRHVAPYTVVAGVPARLIKEVEE